MTAELYTTPTCGYYRQAKKSILSKFNLKEISRYFHEYEKEIKK